MGRGNNTDFEEKFDDVMQYVKVRLDGKGQAVKIRDEQDLKELIERLDDTRRDQQGEKRMSKSFIDGIVSSRKARALIGGSIGRFGAKAQVLKRDKASKGSQEGRVLYRYGDRIALKGVYRSRKQNLIVLFRDSETGRFVKKANIEGELSQPLKE